MNINFKQHQRPKNLSSHRRWQFTAGVVEKTNFYFSSRNASTNVLCVSDFFANSLHETGICLLCILKRKKLKQMYAMSPERERERGLCPKMPKYIGHDMAFGRLTKCEPTKAETTWREGSDQPPSKQKTIYNRIHLFLNRHLVGYTALSPSISPKPAPLKNAET